jgi:hypothetical protein
MKVRSNTSIDFSEDLTVNIVLPVMPLCRTSDLTAEEKLELQDLSVVRTKFSDSFLWQDQVLRFVGMSSIHVYIFFLF